MISTKTNISLDKITKGVLINKNQETDYSATIVINCDKDVIFEYAVVDENHIDDVFIPFTQAKKYAVVKHTNTDSVYRKKMLLLKSPERTTATVDIQVDRLYSTPSIIETVGGTGPRGTILLSGADAPTGTTKKEWYKDPLTITLIVVAIAIIIMLFMSARKKDNNLFIN